MSVDSDHCAFCNRLEVAWNFSCHQFTAGGKVYDSSWPSCETCKSYIDRNDIGALIIHMSMAGADVKLDLIQVLKEFVANRAKQAVPEGDDASHRLEIVALNGICPDN